MSPKSIKLPNELLAIASREAIKAGLTIEEHISYYFRLGRLAEQYEELPISLLKSLMISSQQLADIPFKPNELRSYSKSLQSTDHDQR